MPRGEPKVYPKDVRWLNILILLIYTKNLLSVINLSNNVFDYRKKVFFTSESVFFSRYDNDSR